MRSLLGQFPLMANCIPDGMFIGTFFGLMALDAGLIGFGVWMLLRGWKMRNRAEGMAYIVLGGIISGVFALPWALVVNIFIPR
jgi:hypothetical protein